MDRHIARFFFFFLFDAIESYVQTFVIATTMQIRRLIIVYQSAFHMRVNQSILTHQ